jgi:hypothetical protein
MVKTETSPPYASALVVESLSLAFDINNTIAFLSKCAIMQATLDAFSLKRTRLLPTTPL